MANYKELYIDDLFKSLRYYTFISLNESLTPEARQLGKYNCALIEKEITRRIKKGA